VLTELGKELRPWVPVVSLVKGLEQGTNMRMSRSSRNCCRSSGRYPGRAEHRPRGGRGVCGRRSTGNARPASGNPAVGLFRTRRFRVYTSDDVVGVEMAGALKNVFAIAVGMGYSLGIGENTRAL